MAYSEAHKSLNRFGSVPNYLVEFVVKVYAESEESSRLYFKDCLSRVHNNKYQQDIIK